MNIYKKEGIKMNNNFKWYNVLKTDETYPPYEDGGPVQHEITCGIDAFVNAFHGIIWTIKQEIEEAHERRVNSRNERIASHNEQSIQLSLGIMEVHGYIH